VGGSADVKLADGVKSPDFSLYENERTSGLEMQSSPTVVWEVAYTEDDRKLARDCARHICGSRGEVLLAIAVDIQHLSPQPGKPRQLESVTCSFWELDDVERVKVWAHGLNKLLRCDGGDDFGETVQPAGTRYMMVLDIPRVGLVKYVAARAKVFEVSMRCQCVTSLCLYLIDISAPRRH
jgi:hypothetical protein